MTGGAIDQTFLTGKRSHPAAPLPRNFRVSHARSDAPFLLKEKGKRAKDSKRRPAAQPRAQHAHKPQQQQQQQHRPGRGAGSGLGLACESTRARISSKEKPTAHSSQPFTESAKKNIKGRTQEVTQRSWVDTLAEKAEHQQSITETQKHH